MLLVPPSVRFAKPYDMLNLTLLRIWCRLRCTNCKSIIFCDYLHCRSKVPKATELTDFVLVGRRHGWSLKRRNHSGSQTL